MQSLVCVVRFPTFSRIHHESFSNERHRSVHHVSRFACFCAGQREGGLLRQFVLHELPNLLHGVLQSQLLWHDVLRQLPDVL